MRSFLVFCLVLIISVYGCKKDKNSNSSVALAPVDLNLYVNNPSYVNLNTVGGWVYVSGYGVRGILVYRYSTTEFKAYERNCTYQSSNACSTVSVDATNIIAVDTCCGSKFLLTDGSVSHGPALFPLKAYNTSYDGSVLHIYN